MIRFPRPFSRPGSTPPPAGRRAGRGAVLLVGGIALAAMLAVLFWPSGSPGDPGDRPPTDAVQGQEREPTVDPGTSVELSDPTRTAPTGSSPDPAADSDRRHPGRLKGELLVRDPANGPPLENWTLVLEPSRILPDADRAGRRRVELTGDQLTFDEVDLPLGGYDVWASAQGWNGPRQSVRLTSRAPLAHLLIEIIPAGSLSGTVVTQTGWPLERVPLFLERERGSLVAEAETAPDGSFAFGELPDGSYVLHVGSRSNPLADPVRIAFHAPGFTLDPIVLPPLATVRLELVDEFENPVPEATISGFGDAGGAASGTTDAFGELLLHGLAPGRWTFRSRVEALGSVVAAFDVPEPAPPPEPPPSIRLALRPARR